jgi:hypothetical protein
MVIGKHLFIGPAETEMNQFGSQANHDNHVFICWSPPQGRSFRGGGNHHTLRRVSQSRIIPE